MRIAYVFLLLTTPAFAQRPMPAAGDLQWEECYGEWYCGNTTEADPYHDDSDWVFSTPEQKGMSTASLQSAQNDLDDFTNLQSLIVVRDNSIVWENYFDGSNEHEGHNIHSASKSIISALVGKAIQDGHIDSMDQPISEIIPDYFTGYSPGDDRHDITVGHLLSMRSGLRWNEDSDEYQVGLNSDWVQYVLDRGIRRTPGTSFRYSTGNFQVLSAVIEAATGMDTPDYAHSTIFPGLNINAEKWSRDPQNIYAGGYNVWVTPRELARFGRLYMNNGEGVLDPNWVTLTTDSIGNDYGDGWWNFSVGGHEVELAWGWAGQFIYNVRDFNLTVVTTTDSNLSPAEPDVEQFLTDIFPSIGPLPDADYNNDGRIDGLDFLTAQIEGLDIQLWESQYTQPSPVHAVPEPVGLVLFLSACMPMLVRP